MTTLERMFGAVAHALRREPWWAEFWSAATAIGWSAVSLAETSAMGQWPSMQVLLQLGGDRFWHAAGMGLGLAQLTVLLLDQRGLRWCAAVAMCWFWAVLTLAVWTAVPGSPGVAVYAGWSAGNLFSILRLVRPAHACGLPQGGTHG